MATEGVLKEVGAEGGQTLARQGRDLGAGQFADVVLELSPAAPGEGFAFAETVKGGAVPRNYIPAVEAGVREALAVAQRRDRRAAAGPDPVALPNSAGLGLVGDSDEAPGVELLDGDRLALEVRVVPALAGAVEGVDVDVQYLRTRLNNFE